MRRMTNYYVLCSYIATNELNKLNKLLICMRNKALIIDHELKLVFTYTWITLKVIRFAILLAQVKIILLYLFKVISLYTNALIHSFEPLFIALVEISFSETFHLFLDSSMKFINVLEIFSTKLFINFWK